MPFYSDRQKESLELMVYTDLKRGGYMAIVDGKVVFDEVEQKEVDRIIQERVARVKSEKPSDYDDLKEISDEISEFFQGSTPSEKKAAIKAYKVDLAAQKELEELQNKVEYEGTSPALLKEIQEAKKAAKEANEKLAAIEKRENDKVEATKAEKIVEANYQAARKELLEKHEVDADELQKNAKFMKFMKGKSGINLIEEYESFIEFVGETESETIAKVNSKQLRSTSGGKGSGSGGSNGLTAEQKAVVDTWNAKNPKMKMSYKEYAEKL